MVVRYDIVRLRDSVSDWDDINQSVWIQGQGRCGFTNHRHANVFLYQPINHNDPMVNMQVFAQYFNEMIHV